MLFWGLAAAVDGSGHVHAVGTTEGRGDGVYYVTNASGAWTTQQITTPARKGTDTTPTLEIDANGVLTITFARWFFYEVCGFDCYRDRSRFDQRYSMDNAAGAWSEPVPQGLPDFDAYISELIGRGGHRYAAYTISSRGDASNVMFATDASGAWVSELVSEGYGPRLALDASGAPRIVFNRDNNEAFLATRQDDTWQTVAVPMGDDLTDAYAGSLLIDSRDRSLVVFSRYEEDNGYRTYVLTRNADGWSEPALLAADATYVQAQLGPGDSVCGIYSLWQTDFGTDDGLWFASLAHGVNTMTHISTSYRIVYDAGGAAQVLAVDSHGVAHVLFATPFDDMDDDPRDVEPLALMYAVGPVP